MPLLAETVIIVSRYRAFMPFGRKIEVKKSKYEIDMCSGSIMDKLISFSLPLMLSGILQLMFNAVDIIVVGTVFGERGAGGCRDPRRALISVFTNLFIGVSLGTSVLTASVSMRRGEIRKSRRPFILRSCWHY